MMGSGWDNRYILEIDNLIKVHGAEELLKRIKIADIEKYLRKKKLENIKS